MTDEKKKVEEKEEVSKEEQVEEQQAQQEQVEEQNEEKAEAFEPSVVSGISKKAFEDLTNRNQQFLLALDNQLIDTELDEKLRIAINKEVCETLIDGQSRGETHKHIYGTVTEAFEVIMEQNFPSEENTVSPDKHIALDGGLLFGSLFTLISGIAMLNPKQEQAAGMGLITLVANYFLAGYAALVASRNMPNPDAPKGKRGYGKYFLKTIGVMFLWVFVVSVTQVLIPPKLNPSFGGAFYVVVSILTFILRWYLKKKLNIRGGLFD